MSKWQHCKFDNWRWLSVFYCRERKWTKNNSVFNWKWLLFMCRHEIRGWWWWWWSISWGNLLCLFVIWLYCVSLPVFFACFCSVATMIG